MSRVKSTRSRGRVSKSPSISKPSVPQPSPALNRRPMLEFFQNIFASLETMLLVPSVFRTVSLARKNNIKNVVRPTVRPLEDLAQEVDHIFTDPLSLQKMLFMSELMGVQFREKLQASPTCMLPSYNHTLPSGQEKGTYLAMDVGGSTFRVALVTLRGTGPDHKKMKIVRMRASPITDDVKSLHGKEFFDWMAERIEEMLDGEVDKFAHGDKALNTGLSWSFPIEQTSMGSGKIQSAGKGFVCFETVEGQDLNGLIKEACRRRNLNISINAIINDGTATLLSHAYLDSSTRFSLILGTGTNAAIHLPVTAIGSTKFGDRPQSWHDEATHVLVNTELSMFGGDGVLPRSRWDEKLNQNHSKPDFQPLEYMITGRYLGEIVRLIIVEAVETAGMYEGNMPPSLREPYSLDTSIVASITADETPFLSTSCKLLHTRHPSFRKPTHSEMFFLRAICMAVAKRAAAYFATSIHALWQLKNGAEAASPECDLLVETVGEKAYVTTSVDEQTPQTASKITFAYDGAVISKFPGFREMCQRYIKDLIAYECATLKENMMEEDGRAEDVIVLESTRDATLFGAAVAVACLEKDHDP